MSKPVRRMPLGLSVTFVAAVAILLPPAAPLQADRPGSAGSPADAGKRVVARRGVVTSANALASEAGLAMLRAGGNAVDAAVAATFAIGVVEPQMSGLGGSGAATLWMKRDGKPAYLDFYASQPADAWIGHVEPALATPGSSDPGAPPARRVRRARRPKTPRPRVASRAICVSWESPGPSPDCSRCTRRTACSRASR